MSRALFHVMLGKAIATYHPVVESWKSNVAAVGGTYSTNDLTGLNALVLDWESNGLIESGLTSGVATSSIVQYCLPGAGTNLAASKIPLLRRSATPSAATTGGATAFTAGKAWTSTDTAGVDTGFTYNGTDSREGFFLVRSLDSLRTGNSPIFHGARQAPIIEMGIYIQSTLDTAAYSEIYSNNGSAEMSGVPTIANIQKNHFANTNTSLQSLYVGTQQLATSAPVTGKTIPNATVKLQFSSTNQQACTFIACGVLGIPEAKISGFLSSIETFRAAIGGL